MYVVKTNKGLSVLLLLLLVTTANASPTIGKQNGTFVAHAVSPASNTRFTIGVDVADTIESDNFRLEQLAVELLSPPDPGIDSSTPKSLPPVPGALLMVLAGFLCVSLVKDHKLWLTALAGLLWVGQTGIHAVPHVALRLGHSTHSQQQNVAGLMYPCYLENSRTRCNMEGFSYIGLLRYLEGIPSGKISLLQKEHSHLAEHEIRAPLCALISISPRIIPVFKCLTVKDGQFVCFTPAFIFENMPRGPPKTS